MIILTSYTSATYKAQIRSAVENGFKQIYSGSCTESSSRAAKNLVAKWFGDAAALTVRQIKDKQEILALTGDFFSDPARKQVFDVWTFDQSAKTPLETLADETDKKRRSQTDATSVEVIASDPWERPRQILGGIKLALRMSLAGQVLLGHELSNIKKDMGCSRGSNKSGPVGQFVRPEKSWPELVQENLGISYKTADRMIDSFEAAKVRLKKLGHQGTLPSGEKRLELLFTQRPTSMTEEDREALGKAVDKLVDGETQQSLLEELKLVKVHVALKGGDTSAHKKKEKPSDAELMGQLAFKFFEPIAEGLQAFRSDKDRDAFLATLDLHSSDESAITLTTLEADLEAALETVRSFKKAKLKTAKGTVVPQA